jgi:RNA polymerase sigma factor (sigma-70 family)
MNVAAKREEEFRRLFLGEYRHVLAYALRRTSSLADAQDVVADTFTVAWRRLGDVPADEGARPWLFGVARRSIANQRRSQRRGLALRERIRGREIIAAETEDEADNRHRLRAVLAGLARLSDDEQEVLRLASWEGLSHSEIGMVLGCSENAAALRLHRARRRLIDVMKEDLSAGHSLDA